MTSKKRDISLDSTTEIETKKQKLDNDSNVEIDIENLSKQTIQQLKVIATSMGILFRSKAKKNDIIEQIKAIHKRKQETLSKQEIDSNLNSFNKGVIEFKIKDGVGASEWSFWKVFRNKFLYRRIMSNMDKKLSVPYDSISSVTDMIKFKKFDMLRDKVIRNQYLTFDCNEFEMLTHIIEITQIFKQFSNDNDQDRLFYKGLFKYYGGYIFNFYSILVKNVVITDMVKGREQLVNQLIDAKCLPALQILIQDYHYKITNGNILHSINKGSIKFIQFTLKQHPLEKSQLMSFIGKTSLSTISKLFKGLKYLQDEKLIDLYYVSNGSNLILQVIKSNCLKIDESISLKSLITGMKLLISKENTLFKSTTINIEEIELFSTNLTNIELSLPLSDKSNQIHKHRKEFIRKLLNCYYSTASTDIKLKPEFYYLYFNRDGIEYGKGEGNGNFSNLYPIKNSNIITFLQLAFQFGNFELLEYTLALPSKIIHKVSQYVNSSTSLDLLFSHCPDNKIKLKFINSFAQTMKKAKLPVKTKQYFSTKPELFFGLLVSHDDIELVKEFVSQLGNKLNFEFEFELAIIKYIKSIKMLEFLFKNYNQSLGTDGIWYFNSIELLKRFELLHCSKRNGKKSKIELPFFIATRLMDPIMLIKIVKHIIESGSNVYTTDSSFLKAIDNCLVGTYEKFEMFKSFFINFNHFKEKQESSFYSSETNNIKSTAYIKFLDWVFINHYSDLKDKKDDILDDYGHLELYSEDFIDQALFFKTHRLNRLSVPLPLDLIDHICIGIGFEHNQDFILLDYILKEMKIDIQENKETLYKILEKLAKFGRIKTFEYLIKNYSDLILNSQTSTFNSKELKSLLFKTLSANHLKCAQYLIEFLPPPTTNELKYQSNIVQSFFNNYKQNK